MEAGPLNVRPAGEKRWYDNSWKLLRHEQTNTLIQLHHSEAAADFMFLLLKHQHVCCHFNIYNQ